MLDGMDGGGLALVYLFLYPYSLFGVTCLHVDAFGFWGLVLLHWEWRLVGSIMAGENQTGWHV